MRNRKNSPLEFFLFFLKQNSIDNILLLFKITSHIASELTPQPTVSAPYHNEVHMGLRKNYFTINKINASIPVSANLLRRVQYLISENSAMTSLSNAICCQQATFLFPTTHNEIIPRILYMFFPFTLFSNVFLVKLLRLYFAGTHRIKFNINKQCLICYSGSSPLKL